MAQTVSVEEFRARVREWLPGRVPLKTPGERFLQWDDEGVARDRAIQRSLWEGRITGATVPVEYGGLGLSAAHQQAFREAAADYRMPESYGNALQRRTAHPARGWQRGLEASIHPPHPQR